VRTRCRPDEENRAVRERECERATHPASGGGGVDGRLRAATAGGRPHRRSAGAHRRGRRRDHALAAPRAPHPGAVPGVLGAARRPHPVGRDPLGHRAAHPARGRAAGSRVSRAALLLRRRRALRGSTAARHHRLLGAVRGARPARADGSRIRRGGRPAQGSRAPPALGRPGSRRDDERRTRCGPRGRGRAHRRGPHGSADTARRPRPERGLVLGRPAARAGLRPRRDRRLRARAPALQDRVRGGRAPIPRARLHPRTAARRDGGRARRDRRPGELQAPGPRAGQPRRHRRGRDRRSAPARPPLPLSGRAAHGASRPPRPADPCRSPVTGDGRTP
jgi:hypothetical protein